MLCGEQVPGDVLAEKTGTPEKVKSRRAVVIMIDRYEGTKACLDGNTGSSGEL